jgi:hypothetical protein
MKKLIVLVLVLSMATIANAGLKIGVGGQIDPQDTSITLRPSDEVVISVYSDGIGTLETEVYMLSVTGLGVIDVSNAINNVNSNANHDTVLAVGDPIPGQLIFMDMITVSVPPTAFPVGTMIDQLIFHCEGVNLQNPDVLLTLTGDVTGVFDTQVIHQIPEPMTMALLGLGGLFLRRRSK